MKKLFLFVCLFSLLLASACYAGPFDREEFKNVGYVDSKTTASDAAITSAPCYVYGVTVYSTSSNGYVNLYNSTDGSGNVKIEVAEATQGDSTRVAFEKPVLFDTACYADVDGAVVIVEYRQ